MPKLWDAIVVGGGPAGVAAALRLAREGLDVVVVEAAVYPGAENWSGAVYFTEVLAQPDVLGPDELESAPFERKVVKRGFYLTNGVAMGGAEYRNPETFRSCYTVLRPVYDHYLAERARRFGATLLNETAVDGLIRDRGRVVGVHTSRGPLYGAAVFLAEGDAAELTSKEGYEPESVRRKPFPQPAFLQGVKEVIALDPAVIEERFGVRPGEGCCYEVVLRNAVYEGRPLRLNMAGFIYTNRASVSVGLILPVENLVRFRGEYNTLMEWFKSLPGVARLIEGGESVSYGAKLVRGGGWREIPRLVDDGFAIGGAATGMGVDFPYPNFTGPATAMGKLFADALLALRAEGAEPTRANLERLYVRRLKETRYYKDVRHLADWPHYIESSDAFFGRQVDLVLGSVYVWTRPNLNPARKVWEWARVVGETLKGKWWRSAWDLHRGSKALRIGRYVLKHLPVALPAWVVQTLWAPLPVLRGRVVGELAFRFWVEDEPAGRLPWPLRWMAARWTPALSRAAHALYANDDRPLGAKLDRAVGVVLRRGSLWELLGALASVAAFVLTRGLQRVAVARPSLERLRRTFYGRWLVRSRRWTDLSPGRVGVAKPHDAKLAEISYSSESASHIKVFFSPPGPGRFEDPTRSSLFSVCPANVYQVNADEALHAAVAVNYENCVKCETCWRASPDVDWTRFGGQRLVYDVYTEADGALRRLLAERTGEPGPSITGDYWAVALARATDGPAAEVVPLHEEAEGAALGQAFASAEPALRRVEAKVEELHEVLHRGPRVLEPGQIRWLQDVVGYLSALCGEAADAFAAPLVREAAARAGVADPLVGLLGDMESVRRRMQAHAASRRFFFADADARQIRDHHVPGLRRILAFAAKGAGVALSAEDAGRSEGDGTAMRARARARERLSEIFDREALRRLDRGGDLRKKEAGCLREIAASLAHGGTWDDLPRLETLAELARLDPALALLVANHLAAVAALEWAGAPTRALEAVRNGKPVVGLALEEPAELRGDRWAGRLPFTTTALADLFLIRGAGRLALVRRTGAGVRVEPTAPIGLVACGVADLVLEGAESAWSGSWRASAEDQLFRLRSRDVAAVARGAGEMMAERAVEHARSRVQFPDHFQDIEGRDGVAKFGAVRAHLARIEAHRLTLLTLLEDAAWSDRSAAPVRDTDPAGMEPKLAKVAVTQALGPDMESITYLSGQVIGGTAYSEDDVISKFYRDSSVFRHYLRPNLSILIEVGRVAAALIRDGRPLGPLASGVEVALEAAERRPILGDLVRRLRRAERTLAEAAAPALDAVAEDAASWEAMHLILGERAAGLYVWERLLTRTHWLLDSGRYAEPWVEAVRLTAETVEERLVGLPDELAWIPVRLGLGAHALELGDYPDAPPQSPLDFSYSGEIVEGRRAYASGNFLQKPLDLGQVRFVPEPLWYDSELRGYHAWLLQRFRQRFAERQFDGLPFDRYVERLHYIPREDIDWALQHGFFRMTIPTALGGEGRTKADYYSLCMIARRLADVSLTLTIQANTSIGTSPILIGLEQDLPAAERDLRRALEHPETVADLRERAQKLIRLLDAFDPGRWEPAFRALADRARKTVGSSRVLKKMVFGAFLDRLQEADKAGLRRDLRALREHVEAALASLDGWEERARDEASEIPLRREAHEFFLRLISARMISAFALTEPSAGSDTARIRTEAHLTSRAVHTEPDGVKFFYLDEEREQGRRNVCDLRRFVFEGGKILYRYRDDAPPAEVLSHEYSYQDEEEEKFRYYLHDGRRIDIHDLALLRNRDGREVYEFYVLSGAKMWITNGHVAGVMSLYARTPLGPTGFMVDAHAEGFQVGKDERKMGQRGSPTNEITLHQVRVPRECIIGIEGRGQENALETLNVGRAGLAVTEAAGLNQALADSRAHVRRSGLHESAWARYLLGRQLEETFAVESIAYNLIGLFEDPTTRSVRLESAIGKLFTTESVHRMLEYGEPLYGPAGQTDRHRIEKDRRDARVLTIYEGTNEVQRFLVLRDLIEVLAEAWAEPSDARAPEGSAFAEEVGWLNAMKRGLWERLRRVRGAYGSAAWQRVLLQPAFFRLADMAALIAVTESVVQRAHWIDERLSAPADAARREWTGMAAGSFAARARREFERLAFGFDRDWEVIYVGGRPAVLRLAEVVLDRADRASAGAERGEDGETEAGGAEPRGLPRPGPSRIEGALQVVVCLEETPRVAPRPRVRDGRVAEHLFTASPGGRRALRLALRLKRAAPERVTVTVACAGPARAEPLLRRALAAGADQALLVDTGEETYAEHAVAAALAGALALEGVRPDLVLAPSDPEAPSGARLAPRLAPRLARQLGVGSWVPETTDLHVVGGEAHLASGRVPGVRLTHPLPLVAAVKPRDDEPDADFDTSGFLRALDMRVKLVPFPSGAEASAEVLAVPAVAPAAEEARPEKVTPERAAEALLEVAGLGARGGGPAPASYTGKIPTVPGGKIEWDRAILLVAEAAGGGLAGDAGGAVSAAKALAAGLRLPLDVAVLTSPLEERPLRDLAGRLQSLAPFRRVWVAESAALAVPSPAAREHALAALVSRPEACGLGAILTHPGPGEALPALAACLRESGLAVEEWHGLAQIEFRNGELALARPVYGRKLRAWRTLSARADRVRVISCEPEVRADGRVAGEGVPGTPSVARARLEWAYTPDDDPVGRASAAAHRAREAVTLKNADFVIDVGAGVGSGENVERILEPLRRALLAAGAPHVEIGATRKVTEDLSLLPQDRQIGQTGVRVNPKVLIALGVSGAPQHLDYIGERPVIFAFNLDPDAPIMTLNQRRERPVVVPVVGDLFEAVPRFVEALRGAARPQAA